MNPIELPSKDSKKPKDLLPSRHHSRFSMNIEHALEFAGFVGFVAGGSAIVTQLYLGVLFLELNPIRLLFCL